MWSRSRIEAIALAASAALLAACGSAPTVPDASPPAPEPRAEVPAGAGDAAARPSQDAADGSGALVAPVEVPPRAAADFERAVGLMRSGNANEAELEFQQLAAGFPQLAGPHVNLGILHRKAGRLDPAIESLRTAVERNPVSAVAWTELGVTLRMRGNFQDAAAAYERAIAVDPAFAPAHRNLGVLRDLYLGDPHGALAALEQYKALTSEEKPVTGWIAELRQRTAKPPAPATAETPAQDPPPQGGEGVVQ